MDSVNLITDLNSVERLFHMENRAWEIKNKLLKLYQ